MPRYTLCGLRLISDLELGLPVADEAGPVDVEVRWARIEAADLLQRDARISWKAVPGALTFAVRGVGAFRAISGVRVEVDPAPGANLGDLVLFVLGSALGAIWLQRGVLALHASAVRTNGRCIAFSGRSGVGKSTIAAFLVRRGRTLVTDDICVIESSAGAAVWPGPQRVKLWRDGLDELGEDAAALSRAGGRREKYHLEVAVSGDAAPVPLGALYVLQDGEAVSLERLSGLEAVEAVAAQTYRRDFVAPLGVDARHFRTCVELARTTAVFRLVRPRGFDRIDAVLDRLEREWS